jgi:hypothetical protein
LRFIYLLLILFLSSCIKNIDYKLKNRISYPIINCILNPDSVCSAYLCYSADVLVDSFLPITNAKVYIYKNDLLFDSLIHQNGIYYRGHLYPDMDAHYSLKVIVDNKLYEAKTFVPLNKILDSATNRPNAVFDAKQNGFVNKLEFYINDPAERNYYELFYGARRNFFAVDSVGFPIGLPIPVVTFMPFTIQNEELYATLDPRIADQINLKLFPNSLLFSDNNFNNAQTSLFINGGIPYLSDTLVAVLRNASKEYIDYRRSYIEYLYNSKLHYNGTYKTIGTFIFPIEPTKMYSNMQGGALGVFAGYSQDTSLIKLY